MGIGVVNATLLAGPTAPAIAHTRHPHPGHGPAARRGPFGKTGLVGLVARP